MVINRNPEYFLTIVEKKSISRAAETLYISQSSLSQHLARLESALGLQLLDRSKNPIQLTESGRIYQNYLESNNHLYQKFRAELSDNQVQTVDIGAGTWRGSILLPDILPDFLKQHPKTQVSLHEFPVSELLTLVRNEMADFAVMNTTEAGIHKELVQKVVVQERILLVMNRNNPVAQTFISRQAEGTVSDLRQLQNECFISLSRNLSVGKHVGNFLDRNRLTFPEKIYTTNNSTALSLTAKNLGFCFLVETGLSDACRRPELVAFDLQSQDLVIPLSLIYKKNSYLSPLVQDAMELVCNYYLEVIQSNSRLRCFAL